MIFTEEGCSTFSHMSSKINVIKLSGSGASREPVWNKRYCVHVKIFNSSSVLNMCSNDYC